MPKIPGTPYLFAHFALFFCRAVWGRVASPTPSRRQAWKPRFAGRHRPVKDRSLAKHLAGAARELIARIGSPVANLSCRARQGGLEVVQAGSQRFGILRAGDHESHDFVDLDDAGATLDQRRF